MSKVQTSISYFITCNPSDSCLTAVLEQLQQDIARMQYVNQCFFYSDAVAIAATHPYSTIAKQLLDLSASQQIPLYICSAAFQKRGLSLSPLGKEDFTFKGLGQFMMESKTANRIRQF
ncbi:MAG: hypothetical protein CR975_00020 [Gammaproteobacteria bacterium]|nr:MAG: hypothetical protein CR975_00020 [Gammaproteobacteria bacterium]